MTALNLELTENTVSFNYKEQLDFFGGGREYNMHWLHDSNIPPFCISPKFGRI